mmetsp:Transcript_8502/g.12688  ORF Transcript_8502/g.12688 Transcript_8502/m.12688 type:complete len:423 (-) Transcript_8502:118-1386(-)
MPRKGGRRKKQRTHVESKVAEGGGIGDDVPQDNIPRSIVARSNKVCSNVAEFIKDLRKLMGPNTASNLKERSYNRTKDYASVASHLGITHLLAISETKSNIVLRVGRFHNGPTLHFRIPQYSLCKHVRASQRRPFESSAAYLTAPLVVLNNFGQVEESHLKLLRVTLQHMFPSINVNTVRLNECRRVVLFHFKKEDATVEMRHYAIRATPVGITRNLKKVLQAKIPNLGELQDISEFLEGGGAGAMSDSEAEDDPAARVELSERYVGSGNGASQQSAMKLTELGPRATLELFKVEKGMCEGDVLYHKFEQKTAAEAAATKARVEAARALKAERKAIQEENVRKKKEAAAALKAEKEERKRKRIEEGDDEDEESDDEDEENYDEELSDRDTLDNDNDEDDLSDEDGDRYSANDSDDIESEEDT